MSMGKTNKTHQKGPRYRVTAHLPQSGSVAATIYEGNSFPEARQAWRAYDTARMFDLSLGGIEVLPCL